MQNRTSHRLITTLKLNEVFVFGSNTIGVHGKGAAKLAQKFGAIKSQGEGLMGQSYGLPTKGRNLKRSLNLDQIQNHVDKFIICTELYPEKTFLVTEIGCGLAGFKPKDIAPLFKSAVSIENVHLPASFWKCIQ